MRNFEPYGDKKGERKMDKQELIDRLRAKAKENGQKAAQYSDYTDKTYFTGIQCGYDRSAKLVDQLNEPEKVVITKEQAEIVEGARDEEYPATCISDYTDEHDDKESLLMNAYVNGYTVEREKRYLVELDGLVTTDGAKQYLTKKGGKWFASRIKPSLHQAFTDEELKLAPIWTQEINRKEVTDDVGC